MGTSIEEDIKYQISTIDESFQKVEELFAKLDKLEDYDEFVDNLSPLDRAKFDLTLLYANNSLFWMYLKSNGIDPTTHPIKDELERIKKQMGRIKEITEKNTVAKNKEMLRKQRIDGEMVKRIVRHELWENTMKDRVESEKAGINQEENWEEEAAEETIDNPFFKKPSTSDETPQPSSSTDLQS